MTSDDAAWADGLKAPQGTQLALLIALGVTLYVYVLHRQRGDKEDCLRLVCNGRRRLRP